MTPLVMLQQDIEKTSFPPFAIHPSFGKLSTGAWLAQISAWTTLVQRDEDLSLPVLQFSSVTQSRPMHWNPMDCSREGLPILHYLPELVLTHIHRGGDAIQPTCRLSSHPLPGFKFPQHQGLFQWVSSSHQVAKILEFQLQHLYLPHMQSSWPEWMVSAQNHSKPNCWAMRTHS